jgi:hypothetical protein
MTALVHAFSQAFGADAETESLKIFAIFSGLGLLLSASGAVFRDLWSSSELRIFLIRRALINIGPPPSCRSFHHGIVRSPRHSITFDHMQPSRLSQLPLHFASGGPGFSETELAVATALP